MLKLYEIADQYREILSLMDHADEDDPETLRHAVQTTLEDLNLDEQFTEKALAVACFTRELEGEALAVKATEDSNRSRRKQIESKVDFLRHYLTIQLQKVGKTELKNHQILVKLRKTPPRIVIDDESAIPDQFKETEIVTTIRKNWMQEALRSGECSSISGIHLETGMALTLR